jgi:predicted AlkP superfamily phosphohydrolase/phosphomutase
MPAGKVLVIGIDGMDPAIAEELMGSGELPNFSRLSRTGSYSRLKTVNPPQSPVAWTSIATGANPGGHGIYDFLGRTPENYLPYLSMLNLEKSGYRPPVKAKTFWEKASERGIRSVVLRWPLTFPPRKIEGSVLAGLGVPDIQGRLGVYTSFSTDTTAEAKDGRGRIVNVDVSGGIIRTDIIGPSVSLFGRSREVTSPLDIEVLDGFIRCRAGKSGFELAEGDWSDWVPLRFSLGLGRHADGICRFYLKSTAPEFNLYMTPVNIPHGTSSFPISAPMGYSRELIKAIGPYATLGMPEDTSALNDGIVDEGQFLTLCSGIMDERENMLRHELKRFKEGILACVFDTTDRIQHMFWRLTDASHPMYNEMLAQEYGNVISSYYKRMDRILGEITAGVSADTLLIVCSDHGFRSFRRAVHLNVWLVNNGFMSLRDGETSCEGLFNNVDWNRTRAYALGLNTVYLNVKGREGKGILDQGEVASTKRELIARLRSFDDSGTRVFRNVYNTVDIYSGKELPSAPDIIVGYESVYRQSWQTAVGGVPSGKSIEDNLKKWSGDHCCDADCVPGVFFTNKKSPCGNMSVLDISPLILDHMGIS